MSCAQGLQRPLSGIRILDFSNLLPGPMATLMLQEAGAEVVKIERPQGGDELRAGTPKWGEPRTSLGFALLNSGKRSVAIDLKSKEERTRLLPLLREADVLVEQFRPGVMERLGLGYEAVREINPKVIYCSITGYGQEGPLSQVAGHDLTYMADTGLLSLGPTHDGVPALPPVLVGDIGAGSLPAVVNILLALRQRDRTGEGCWLDVSITDNLLAFPYSALARGASLGEWPVPGKERLTGGTPRYQIYRTSDGRCLAAAPLEQRFWDVFCEIIGLDVRWRNDSDDPEGTRNAVAQVIMNRSSEHWRRAFEGRDACVAIVSTLKEVHANPHFRARKLFDRTLRSAKDSAPALAVPLDRQFLREREGDVCPPLGEGNGLLARPAGDK